ncbi:hypothetical protein B0A55_01698 [Friedmanniomyces simplex]|uniref:Mid2 domain-containing protein n=1 Tax=Friedmanniomyces simplex TaxID=329884 RepID=A0A4V5NKJ8_9PEZI|nr:hypothetical protein B0A55_01698 [Friedmanniomyces simplex]
MARLLAYGFVSFAYAQTCYWPDGTQTETNWTPCDASKSVTSCCDAADLCLNNGYCFSQAGNGNGFPNRLVRGACTDKSWKSGSCPQYCSDISTGGQQTIALVQDEANGYFCCGFGTLFFDGSNCTTGTRGSTTPFSLDPEIAIFNRSDGSTAFSTCAVAAGATNVLTSTVTSTVSVTATTASASGSSNPTSVVAVGAGVAIPLGVLLVAVAGIAIILWRRNKKLVQQLEEKERAYEARMGIDQKSYPSYGAEQRGQLLVSEVDGTSIVPELDAGEHGVKRGSMGK